MTAPDALAEDALNQAIALHRAGRVDAAAGRYQRLLVADPALAPALHLLGVAAQQRDALPRALSLITRAIIVAPAAPYFNNLGAAQGAMGLAQAAERSFRAALALRHDYADAWLNLGDALIRQDRSDEAIAALCRAAALDPARGAVYRRLAAARILNRNATRGIWASRIALRLDPRDAQAWASLAVARYELGWHERAVATAKQALRLDPALVDGHATLGAAMLDLVRPAESVRSYDRLLVLRPRLDSAIWNRALARLLLGDYTLGWRDFAARWHTPAFRPYRRRFDCPAWTPQRGGGGTVLVHSEQGLGDIIQMLRYVPLIVAKGWRVVLELPPALHRLGARLPGVVRVLPPQARPPRVDAVCALLDLPLLFGTTLATIPAVTPYLTADPVAQAFWRLRLKALVPEGRRIGLVWRGNPQHGRDHLRSMPAPDLGRILGPVLALPGVHIVTLQVPADPIAIESLTRAAPMPGRFTDLGPDLKDMAETAAILSCLDGIVTVDTAVAHLAGALGRPGLVALPFSPDWRWLTGRDDSPWYPTLRLCRQPEPGAWEAVGLALADALDQASRFREGRAGAA